jgi:hypothetical protein
LIIHGLAPWLDVHWTGHTPALANTYRNDRANHKNINKNNNLCFFSGAAKTLTCWQLPTPHPHLPPDFSASL